MSGPGTAARTSASHPLQIAELRVGRLRGRLGVTFCPGKQGDSVFGAPWQRDLAADLDVIERWGAKVIVTLVETHELQMLGVPDLGLRVTERGMTWHHVPIPDLQPPGAAFNSAWAGLSTQLREVLAAGGGVLVHCRGGLGRAGTVAACILVDSGMAPPAAIAAVRQARPNAIETRAQEDFVLAFGNQGAGRRH